MAATMPRSHLPLCSCATAFSYRAQAIQQNFPLTTSFGSILSRRKISWRRKRAYLQYAEKLQRERTPPPPPPPRKSPGELVFGRPLPKLNAHESKLEWPKTYEGWKILLSETWKDYVRTFDGLLWPEPEKTEPAEQNQTLESIKGMLPKQEEVGQNLKQNYVFMRYEGKKLVSTAKEVTGIHTREDLREFMISMLKLVNDCLNEFMAGYRKGRDDEMQLMMTRDFSTLFAFTDDEDDKSKSKSETPPKPKRRRIKPRKRPD